MEIPKKLRAGTDRPLQFIFSISGVSGYVGGWLRQVSRVSSLGSFMIASGALAIALATSSFLEHRLAAAIGSSIRRLYLNRPDNGRNVMTGLDSRCCGMAVPWPCNLRVFWRAGDEHLTPLERRYPHVCTFRVYMRSSKSLTTRLNVLAKLPTLASWNSYEQPSFRF